VVVSADHRGLLEPDALKGASPVLRGAGRSDAPGLPGTDLSVHTVQDITRVAVEVNERPRKTLGWQRPADLLHAAIAAC